MADKDDKNPTKPAATSAQPGFDPKPVQVGGESLLERLVPHMKKIVIALAIVMGIIGVVMVVYYVRDRGRKQETEKLVRVLDLAQQQVRPAGAPAEPTPPNAKEQTFPSNKDRAKAVVAKLDQEGAKAAGSFRASLLVQAGELDPAIEEYKKNTKGKTLDAVLAREGLGIALEMKAEQQKDAAARQKGLEEALETFKTMQPDEKGPRYAYALYHQGRILALLGKTAEARTQLEKAKELGANTQLPELIDERLASLGE